LRVHLTLDATPLARRLARVEDDLGIETGGDDAADDPFGVTHDGAAQEDGVKGDGRLERVAVLVLTAVVGLEGGLVPEHVVVGRLGCDNEASVGAVAGIPKV
jgi:hypothetical protein